MDSSILLAAAPVFVIASLAMPAGIGGGLLYVPLVLLTKVVDTPNAAAALSQPIVVGAALAANSFNLLWQRRNPSQRLVEADLALSAICPCLAGAVIGSLLNQMLPKAIIIVLLMVVIIWNLQHSTRKAVLMWKKETAAKEQLAAARTASAAPTGSCTGVVPATAVGAPGAPADGQVGSRVSGDANADATSNDGSTTTVPSTTNEEELDTPHSTGTFNYFVPESASDGAGLRRRIPTSLESGVSNEVGGNNEPTEGAASQPASDATSPAPDAADTSGRMTWVKLLAVWLLLIVAIVLRGGKGTSSIVGITMCSWAYWSVTSAIILCLLLLGLWFRHPQISLALGFFVGVLSAVVGIGGGLILNPMLLATGLDATKTTATVAVIILLVCSSATTTLALAGAVPILPMLCLSAAAFLGSLSGKTIIGWIVTRTGRTSILVFLLAGFMVASGAAVVIQGGVGVVTEIASGDNPFAEFTSPCE